MVLIHFQDPFETSIPFWDLVDSNSPKTLVYQYEETEGLFTILDGGNMLQRTFNNLKVVQPTKLRKHLPISLNESHFKDRLWYLSIVVTELFFTFNFFYSQRLKFVNFLSLKF